jgi:RNA polymerase sigma factor (TIGR02999 family)
MSLGQQLKLLGLNTKVQSPVRGWGLVREPPRLPMTEVTRILSDIERGAPQAAARLLPLVYEELRELAAQRLAREMPGQTLQPTALVHDAYIRLVGEEPERPWDGRRHFFAAAAEAMRRILIDRARDRRRQKRGGGHRRVRLDLDTLLVEPPADDLLALDEALLAMARVDPEGAELVRLRAFAGLTLAEAADAMKIGCRTADRYWAYARAWLCDFLDDKRPSPE